MYLSNHITSAPIGAYECNFPPFYDKTMTDRPSNQPTDQPTDGRTGGVNRPTRATGRQKGSWGSYTSIISLFPLKKQFYYVI